MYRPLRLFSQRASAFARRPTSRNFFSGGSSARGQQNSKPPEFDFKQLEKDLTRLIQEVREKLNDEEDGKKKTTTINQEPDIANFAGSVMDFWERLEIKFNDELKTVHREHKELIDAVSALSKDVYSKLVRDVENAADWDHIKAYFVEVHEAAWVLLTVFTGDGTPQKNVEKMNAQFKEKCPRLYEKLNFLHREGRAKDATLHPDAQKFVDSIFDNYEVLSALKALNFGQFAKEVSDRYNVLPEDAKKDLRTVLPVITHFLENINFRKFIDGQSDKKK